MRNHLVHWAQFLRVPNLLTVPGDVWVGAVLTGLSPWQSPWPSVCLAYLFGMGMNDWVDAPRDRKTRPERPLASGVISRPLGGTVTLVLAALAFGGAPTPRMVTLLLCIAAYNLLKERLIWSGPMLMAACRLLAVWMGAGETLSPALAAVMVAWGGWILCITWLAWLEGRGTAGGVRLFCLTVWMLGVSLGLGSGLLPRQTLLVLALQAGLVLGAGWLGWRMYRRGRILPSDIGAYLRLLLPMQALVLESFGFTVCAVVLLVAWPCLTWISRRFPMS